MTVRLFGRDRYFYRAMTLIAERTTLHETKDVVMRQHRFAVGSQVTYTQARFPNLLSGEACKIVALLPSGSREPRYQVRCPTLTGKLVVSESELDGTPEPRARSRRGAGL